MKKTSVLRNAILSLFTMALLLSFIPVAHAGSWNGWIYQNPYPTSNTLLAVKFVTPKKGWVVGEGGMILCTEDGGENWHYQESGTEQALSSITFVNEKVGWAVGEQGIIIYTSNGGKSWVTQTKTELSLLKVFFVNDHEGWAVGREGILHTTDGGKKWVRRDTGTKIKRPIVSIHFINSLTGWLLAGGEVYRTKNGGKNWEQSTLPRSDYPRFGAPGAGYVPDMAGDRGDIFFTDDKNGWAVVGFGLIFHTKNGGKTWKNQFRTGSMSYGLSRLSFIDEKKGCAGGSSLLCTEDGGKTWTEKLGVPPGSGRRINHFMVQLQGISFSSQPVGWSVGNEGQTWKTEDGGRTWKLTARRDECGGATFFLDKKTGWFHGTGSLSTSYICRTDDGGITRKRQGVGIRVEGIFFIDNLTGWAVGETKEGKDAKHTDKIYGVIRHTTDGGETWTTQSKELMGKEITENGLLNVYFVNRDAGWAVGEKGFILHTADGGKHWEKQKSGTNDLFLEHIYFVNPKVGWIAGSLTSEQWYGGVLCHTEDGGSHWRTQYKIEGILPDSIFISDNSSIWITGKTEYGEGRLLRTEDSGGNWSLKEFGNTGHVYLAFLDKGRGMLSTETGWIIVTTDGGKTWVKKRKPLRKNPWHFSEVFTGAQGAKQLVTSEEVQSVDEISDPDNDCGIFDCYDFAFPCAS